MRVFLDAGKLLLLDLASTILFIAVFVLTHHTYLSVGLGVALGLVQIGTQFARRKPIETMEWLSLFLVVAAGTVTLVTDDVRYVLFKPSAIYTIFGIVMLKPGWINRFPPATAWRSSRTSPS
jgi:intracellular septation protein A